MKKKLFGLLFLFALFACDDVVKEIDQPADLIPQEKMIELITDMLILEAHIQNQYGAVNRYYKVMSASGKAYLKSKGITDKQYADSYNYYNSDKDLYLEMMEQVEENLLKESYQTKK